MGVFANTGIYGFLSSCKATGKQIANKAGILAKEYAEYFVSGFAGHGWKIWEYRKGKYKLEIDTLFVRETMTVFEMLVQKIRALVGSLGITQGCGKIKEVKSDEMNYYLALEDEMTFVAGDFIRCQSRRADAISGYWVKVSEIRDDGTVVIPKSEFAGEIISISGIEQVVDSTAAMAVPAVGDEIVQFGNENPESGRNSAIYLHADENGEPAIDVLFGIISKSFANCVKVRMGGDIPGSGGKKGFYCENGMIKCVDSSGSLMYQLNPDGSFNLGRGGINYDPDTNTLAFGKNVKLTWDNIDPGAQEELKGKDAEMYVIEFLNENHLAVTNILASGLGKPVTPGDVEGFLYKISGNTKTALEAFWKLTVTDLYGEVAVSYSEAGTASFAFDPGSNLDGRLYTLAAYTGVNGTGDKLVEATIPKILNGLSADTLYPWLAEWDGHKTTILDEEVVSPKMFSGKKNDDGTLTGAAFGRGIVYVDGKEKIGIFGIKNGKLTFFLDAETGDIEVEGKVKATSGYFYGNLATPFFAITKANFESVIEDGTADLIDLEKTGFNVRVEEDVAGEGSNIVMAMPKLYKYDGAEVNVFNACDNYVHVLGVSMGVATVPDSNTIANIAPGNYAKFKCVCRPVRDSDIQEWESYDNGYYVQWLCIARNATDVGVEFEQG